MNTTFRPWESLVSVVGFAGGLFCLFLLVLWMLFPFIVWMRLNELRRHAIRQSDALEEIARNTRPAGGKTGESSVAYRIRGLND